MAEVATLALITKAMVKTYYNISVTDYDGLIDAHLIAARSYVQNYCRNDFQSTTRTAEKPIVKQYDEAFYLNHYPIASITSLTEDDVILTENTDFYVDKNTGKVEKIFTPEISNPDRGALAYWSYERNAISVTYVGGEALTDDIIMVVKEYVGISAGLKKRTYTDNEGVERVATISSLPKYLYDVLNMHKRRNIGRG